MSGKGKSFLLLFVVPITPGVQWALEEQEGGSITQEGVYAAPRVIGIYHVIAIATTKGTALARAIAKVTVVTEYDSSPLPVAAK